jgi:hypothetical protein
VKIIAVIQPAPYEDPRYIVDLATSELEALVLLRSSYGAINVTSATGHEATRERLSKLQVGDVIDEDVAIVAIGNIRYMIEERDNIDKAFTQVRTAMTKLQKILPGEI